ncbi:MAG: NAD(P)-dependent oxidoreductase [Rhodobacteraceae bacterium]|nr:NAD(P)-dependent oxidoreductase [Paracoccaceae bacterium]
MRIGFIGLGNVGGKLAGSLLRHGFSLRVFDIDADVMTEFAGRGATACRSPAELGQGSDVIITCLPSPEISTSAALAEDGFMDAMGQGKVWCEMSTTDEREVKRLGRLVEERGGHAADCPVSGGCHRAATGNISIFAGSSREVFELLLPMLSRMGRRILHTGPLGSATVLKVLTNYLASANLLSICEALATAKLAGMDLSTTYEAIRISSGNSFVHETEGQVILNGSRNINFTMDLVLKDIRLFGEIAKRAGIELELLPLMIDIFDDAHQRLGGGEWSPNVIRRLEERAGMQVTAPGFPDEIVDDEPERRGCEVVPRNRNASRAGMP